MRKFGIPFILVVLSLTLIGCRDDKATPHTSAADSGNAAPPADSGSFQLAGAHNPALDNGVTDSRPVIVCFGDSLTAGLGMDPGQSYPDDLQDLLDTRGFRYRVVNRGISGNTTKDGVNRLPAIVALHPAVVIIEFGGNDGLRGLPIAEARTNLDLIISTLKSSGAKLIIAGITLPPDYGPDYIKQFNDIYPQLAAKYKVPLLPFILQNVYGVDGMMQRDNIHATATGNKVVAGNVLPFVIPLLQK